MCALGFIQEFVLSLLILLTIFIITFLSSLLKCFLIHCHWSQWVRHFIELMSLEFSCFLVFFIGAYVSRLRSLVFSFHPYLFQWKVLQSSRGIILSCSWSVIFFSLYQSYSSCLKHLATCLGHWDQSPAEVATSNG